MVILYDHFGGIRDLGTASGPAVTRDNKLTDKKKQQCKAVVDQIFALLDAKIHTRQIMTRKVHNTKSSNLQYWEKFEDANLYQ